MRKYLRDQFAGHKHLSQHSWFALLGKSRLLQPDLWYFNRYNVARGLAAGLFVAMVPVPGQMLLAACVAFLWRANLPISIAAVWITNPFTMVPIFYLNLLIGRRIIDLINMHESAYSPLWQPLLVGSLLVGFILALLAYFAVLWLWRVYVRNIWRQRRLARK